MNVTRNQKIIAISTALLLVGGAFVIANNASRKPFTAKPPVNTSADAKSVAVQTQAGAFLLNANAALVEADALCSTYWKEKGFKTLPESRAFFLRKGNVDTGPIQGSFICGPSIRGGSLLGGFEAGSWIVTQSDKGLTFSAKEISQFNTTVPVGYFPWRPDNKPVGDPNKLNLNPTPVGTVIPPSSLLNGRLLNDNKLLSPDADTNQYTPLNTAPIPLGSVTIQKIFTQTAVGLKDGSTEVAPADKVIYRVVYDTKTMTDPVWFTVDGQPVAGTSENSTYGQGVGTATFLAGVSENIGMTNGKAHLDFRAATVTSMFLDPELMVAGASVPPSSMAAKSAVAAAQVWADAIGGGDLGRAIAIMDEKSVGNMFDETRSDGAAGLTTALSWGNFGEQGLRPGVSTKEFTYVDNDTGTLSCTNPEGRNYCSIQVTTKLGRINLHMTHFQTGVHEFKWQIGILDNQKPDPYAN
jgi:hypothetical protein